MNYFKNTFLKKNYKYKYERVSDKRRKNEFENSKIIK